MFQFGEQCQFAGQLEVQIHQRPRAASSLPAGRNLLVPMALQDATAPPLARALQHLADATCAYVAARSAAAAPKSAERMRSSAAGLAAGRSFLPAASAGAHHAWAGSRLQSQPPPPPPQLEVSLPRPPFLPPLHGGSIPHRSSLRILPSTRETPLPLGGLPH